MYNLSMNIKHVDIALFEAVLKDIFKLKCKPYISKVKTLKFDGDACLGMYDGYEKNPGKFVHKIRIARDCATDVYQLFGTIAHEYIHAWQHENNLEVDHSVASGYTKWQKYFQKHFKIEV